jgi:antitoxin (DNA-binding transcriptional repressor) of toxin-antitoxin stability system
MVTVAINDVPQLSQYLRRAHNGERIVITEGDTVVAELLAPEPDAIQNNKGSLFWKNITQLSSDGDWELAEKRESSARRPRFSDVEGIDYMAILDEVRADRF